MRTADDKRTLRRSRGAVHSRISHGRHDGSPEALPWTGQNVGSAARGNRLLPCVCCCIFPVYAVEKKGKDPLSGEIADGRAQDRSGCIFDTGNGLYDSVLQRPVSIIRKETLEKLCDADTMEKLREFQMGKAESGQDVSFQRLHPHFLVFSSLGCSSGLLVAVTLDAMYLENEEVQKVIRHPVVAFSGDDSSYFGDCQMILHPNLIDS